MRVIGDGLVHQSTNNTVLGTQIVDWGGSLVNDAVVSKPRIVGSPEGNLIYEDGGALILEDGGFLIFEDG